MSERSPAESAKPAGGKTTPGPWHIEGVRDPILVAGGTIPAKGNERVALVGWMGDARLIAAAPALADEHERAVQLIAHIVEFSHYTTDEDAPAEILKRIEAEAREVAKLIGYDGYTSAALRAAGRSTARNPKGDL